MTTYAETLQQQIDTFVELTKENIKNQLPYHAGLAAKHAFHYANLKMELES